MLLGRKSFAAMTPETMPPGMAAYVFSRTLRQSEHPGVTIVSGGLEETVKRLKTEPGKDIWLFGGGSLFRSLADAGLVDSVEVAVVPILLGEGIPLIEGGANQVKLELKEHRVYSKTGIVMLTYEVA